MRKLFIRITSLVLIPAFTFGIFAVQPAHAVNIDLFGATLPQSGVQSASTTAADVNLATLLAGENTVINRMMVTPSYTCFATTTDTLVKSGSGVLGLSAIAAHSSDITVSFYDATTTGTISNRIAEDFALNAANGIPKPYGAAFATGLYMDITGTGTTTVCYN